MKLIEESVVIEAVANQLSERSYRTWIHSNQSSSDDSLTHQIRLGGHFPDILALSPARDNLVAVECKGERGAVLKAFGQAMAYRQASNTQYIAIPESGWRLEYRQMAQSIGLGVMLVDEEESVISEVEPVQRTWPNTSQLQAVKQILNLPFDASPEFPPRTTRPEPYILAVLLAEEIMDLDKFRSKLQSLLPSGTKRELPTMGFVNNVIRSVVSLQLLSTKGSQVRLSNWGRQLAGYFKEADGSLEAAIARVRKSQLESRYRGKPDPDIGLAMGMVIRQHPSVSFLLSVLTEMQEAQGKSLWNFMEVFDYLKQNYPWETIIFLTSPKAKVPTDPARLKLNHLMSHLLDDTIRQLVHARILGDRSKPLTGSRTGAKDVVIELL